jgi:hypothetical protein
MKYYTLLGSGDLIRESDEYWDEAGCEWSPRCMFIGKISDGSLVIRRPAPTPPAPDMVEMSTVESVLNVYDHSITDSVRTCIVHPKEIIAAIRERQKAGM